MLHQELRSLHESRSPLAGPEKEEPPEIDPVMDTLTKEMQNLLIESRLRSHPVLRSMWDRITTASTKVMPVSISSPETDIPTPTLTVPKISIPISDAAPSPTSTFVSLNSPMSDTTTIRRRSPSQEVAYLSDHSTKSSASTLLGRRSLSPSESFEEKISDAIVNGLDVPLKTGTTLVDPAVLNNDSDTTHLRSRFPGHNDE